MRTPRKRSRRERLDGMLSDIQIASESRSKYGTSRTARKVWRGSHGGNGIIQRGEFNARLKRKYGITRDQYDQILKTQGGVCAICGGPPIGRFKNGPADRFDLDHCHKTKKVRGLLCHPCNVMLGHARDQIGILQAAISYLKRESVDAATS